MSKCKGDNNCAPMNKWFWIEGHSDNPTLGKKGENIDPKLRKYIALNSEFNFTQPVAILHNPFWPIREIEQRLK